MPVQRADSSWIDLHRACVSFCGPLHAHYEQAASWKQVICFTARPLTLPETHHEAQRLQHYRCVRMTGLSIMTEFCDRRARTNFPGARDASWRGASFRRLERLGFETP